MTTRRRAAVASTLAALALVATIVGIRVWTVRELVATSAAVVDVHLRRPTPILGPRLPIARAGLE